MAFDDDADALREMRLLWLNQQGAGIKGAASRDELCAAVFVKGRGTITAVDGGAIAPGKAADLIVLDYAAMTADCLDDTPDELELLLTRARREHVKSVVVAGREIVRDGILRSIDLATAQAELLEQARAGWPQVQAGNDLRRRLHTAISRYYECGCHLMTR
jgi:cytosine/adenosine deaminase-related metal-dependent hydrolase